MKKLIKLRKFIKIYKLDGYLVPKNDEFFGEYVDQNNDRLKFISSFSGSAGHALILNKKVLLKFFVTCLISVSFFLGYFLRENAVGGGPEFYELSWPIIQSFKEDFSFTIKNYGSFSDFTIPF